MNNDNQLKIILVCSGLSIGVGFFARGLLSSGEAAPCPEPEVKTVEVEKVVEKVVTVTQAPTVVERTITRTVPRTKVKTVTVERIVKGETVVQKGATITEKGDTKIIYAPTVKLKRYTLGLALARGWERTLVSPSPTDIRIDGGARVGDTNLFLTGSVQFNGAFGFGLAYQF